MITEVPTAHDFAQASVAALNLAWDVAAELSWRYSIAIDSESYDKDEISDAYWSRAQQRLGNAISLVQQGLELAIKSRIASVSPFLLIANRSDSLPPSCATGIPFSDFKTIDAKDLIRVHDVFAEHPLSGECRAFLERNRRLRNQLIHGVGKADRITERQIFADVLRAIHLLPGLAASWPKARLDYLTSQTSESAIGVDDYPLSRVLEEFAAVVKLLRRKDLFDFVHFDNKARRYICPSACYSDMSWNRAFRSRDMIRLAQIRPNSPHSATVFCFVCGKSSAVVRSACKNGECPSNVIGIIEDEDFRGAEDEKPQVCLVCGVDQAATDLKSRRRRRESRPRS